MDAIIFEACWPAPVPECAGPDGRPAKSNNGRSGHVPPFHGPHPGCLGTSTSGEAPVLLAALVLDRVEAIHIYLATIAAATQGLSALHTGAAA